MASRKIEDLHPTLQEVFKFGQSEWETRYPDRPVPFLTTTYRSHKEQDEIYAKGRTKKGPKVTNAKAWQSPHNYFPSLAFDVSFKKNGKAYWDNYLFEDFSNIVKEKYSDVVTWGGDFRSFKDRPHFELKGWESEKKAS